MKSTIYPIKEKMFFLSSKKRKLIFSFFSLFFCTTSFATNYYVSPTGSDAANGSEATPFMTIAKAATIVNAGDTVFVAEGTYSEQNITPKSSGTETAMIVFKPLKGTGNVIVMHPGTSISDNTPVFQLSNRNYIWIEGFQFKNFSYGKACIYISSGEGNVVINNRFENLGNGEVGSWDGNQMVALFNSTKNVVCNNYFKNITGDGININSQRTTYNLVCNNTFIDFSGKLRSWGGEYLYSRAIDVQDMSDGNNVIAFNNAQNVYNHIWLDRDGSNNIILRNFGRKGSGNVFNESRCAKNVIQENISIEMSVGYLTALYDGTGWTFDPRWVNNVAYNNATGFSVHKSWRDEFRNNIAFNNTDYNLKFTQEAFNNAPHIFSNNLWFTANKTNSIQFKGNAVSVEEFQTGVRETGGLSVDPLFVSTISGSEDFNLQTNSPAKKAADNGLDLGAYAAYPQTEFGWNQNRQTANVQIYFDQVISASSRGNQIQLVLKLNKAATETVTANITPVAGDALSGEDFTLSGTTVVFQPGETNKTVSVDIKGSSDFDELVAFRITNVTNAVAGARDLHVLRINKTLKIKAYAGNNQSVWESNHTGTAEVVLDGSLSQNPFGDISSYEWDINGVSIATGVSPTVTLPIGANSITLTVKDADGNSATDKVVVTVKKVSGIWLESECGIVGSLWNIVADSTASNGKYVTVKDGNNSNSSAPSNASGLITYTFDVSESGTYKLFARVICPTSNDDSFWLKMNSGTFASWNGIGISSTWQWFAYPNTYNLTAGSNTLTIGYREDGAKLDKLWLTNNGDTPDGQGSDADNCSTAAINSEQPLSVAVYPNPVSNILNIVLPGSPVTISIINSNGQILYQEAENRTHKSINISNFRKGIYLVRIVGQHQTIGKKIVKD